MTVNIQLEGEGLKYTGTTSIFKASQVIAFLNTATDSGIPNGDNPSQQTLLPMTPINGTIKSAREELLSANAKTNPQKILVCGKYWMDTNKAAAFDQAAVKNVLRRAGEPVPANFSRDWSETIKQAYITEDPSDPDKFIITGSGYDALTNGFSGTAVTRRGTGRRKHASSGASGIRDELKQIEFVAQVEGLPMYHDVATKGDRVLWLLNFAVSKGLDSLSNAEIEFAADRLRDKIAAGTVSGNTESNFHKNRLSRTTDGKLRILQPGIEYIKAYSVADQKKAE